MNCDRSAGQAGNQGDAPDELLAEFIDDIPIGRALDLGMGDGKSAVWLAERGFDVVGIDLSATAVHAAQRLSRERGVVLETHVADIREWEIEPDRYALVLASAVLHFLLPQEIRDLAIRIKAGLQPGGCLIVQVFTVDDPGYQALREQGASLVAERTFFVPEIEGPLHYFALGELRSLFKDLEILYYAEERHLDASSLDEPHYHAGAFLVARKRSHRGQSLPASCCCWD